MRFFAGQFVVELKGDMRFIGLIDYVHDARV